MKTLYFRCIADFENGYITKDCQNFGEVKKFYEQMKQIESYKRKEPLLNFQVFRHEVLRVTNSFFEELDYIEREKINA